MNWYIRLTQNKEGMVFPGDGSEWYVGKTNDNGKAIFSKNHNDAKPLVSKQACLDELSTFHPDDKKDKKFDLCIDIDI
jgi:hypothetical protein